MKKSIKMALGDEVEEFIETVFLSESPSIEEITKLTAEEFDLFDKNNDPISEIKSMAFIVKKRLEKVGCI